MDKEHMARIGAEGGRAGKGSPLRIKLNTRAANIRWNKYRETQRNLNISPNKSPMKPIA